MTIATFNQNDLRPLLEAVGRFITEAFTPQLSQEEQAEEKSLADRVRERKRERKAIARAHKSARKQDRAGHGEAQRRLEQADAAIQTAEADLDRLYARFRYRQGWNLAKYDPNRLLACFPRLRLAEGRRLAAYQYIAGGNGKGTTVVVSAGTSLPELPADLPREAFPPPTLGGIADLAVLSYLRPAGEPTPRTFLEASLFMREIEEIGAMWHDCRWRDHQLLFAPVPGRQVNRPELNPSCWEPSVEQSGGRNVVRLHTLWGSIVCQHLDVWTDALALAAPSRCITLIEGAPIVH